VGVVCGWCRESFLTCVAMGDIFVGGGGREEERSEATFSVGPWRDILCGQKPSIAAPLFQSQDGHLSVLTLSKVECPATPFTSNHFRLNLNGESVLDYLTWPPAYKFHRLSKEEH